MHTFKVFTSPVKLLLKTKKKKKRVHIVNDQNDYDDGDDDDDDAMSLKSYNAHTTSSIFLPFALYCTLSSL